MENKFICNTALIKSHHLSERLGAQIYLKCENFQRSNSFKIRGASNFVNRYVREKEKPLGFCTHSSGNHGKALAYVCQALGIPCHIVVPNNAPDFKVQAMKNLGAQLVFCAPDTASRLEHVKQLEKCGFVQVPPYNHPWIMEGQGTVAKEILEQRPDVDCIICPVGGGGLSGGISYVLRELAPEVQLILAEPERANETYKSLQSGNLLSNDFYDSVADGLRANLGNLNFEALKTYPDLRCVCCTEEAIVAWAQYALQEEKILIEPSCATALAVLDSLKNELEGKTVVLVITGGNVDPNLLLNLKING